MPPRSRRVSRELTDEPERLVAAPAAAEVEEKPEKPDMAKILRDMEEDVARDVEKVTAERSAVEKTEKEARDAEAAIKIGAAARQVAELEKEAEGDGPSPDRLVKVRARRRSRDLTDEAKDLLGATLAGAFKALDLNGDGTLDHSEVQKAFANSGNAVFSDDTFKPILEDEDESPAQRCAAPPAHLAIQNFLVKVCTSTQQFPEPSWTR